MNDMMTTALDYASRDRKVFPCGISKRPLTKNGLKAATTDQETIRGWWTKHPDASIGAPTGGGFFVLDIDLPDGQAALDVLEKDNSPLPPTLEQRTGSGGRHLFFLVDTEIRNSAGKLGKNIDIRGDGGYVILPPSSHEKGSYKWINSNSMAAAPQWLLDKLTKKEQEKEPKKEQALVVSSNQTIIKGSYGRQALENEIIELKGTGKGSRNHQLNRASFSLGQLVAGGELNQGQVESDLLSAALSIGLSSEEANITIKSGMDAGMQDPRTAPQSNNTPVDIFETVKRLAVLPPLEYDQIRNKEAKNLGVRSKTLDAQVSAARKEAEVDPVGRIFPDDDLWDYPVNGEQLLDELTAIYSKYSILPRGSNLALALWTILTYCYDDFRTLPILCIISPEKRCGKTTTLETLSKLCCRSIPASNISPAALYRSVEKFKPTLLIDEADTFLKTNEDLRGIINAGHTKAAAFTIKCDGENNEPRMFSLWCPKAISMIGNPPNTIVDRSVVVPLRRKFSGETVIQHEEDHKDIFRMLREKMLRFASDNQHILKIAKPERLATSNDRSADNWKPLLSIASVCSREEEARLAAKALISSEQEDETPAIMLLDDINVILNGEYPLEKISSKDLVLELTHSEDRPWCEWKKGKPMTQNSLAKQLKNFGIKSKKMRVGDENIRGYERSDFDDAFNRYIGKKGSVLGGGERVMAFQSGTAEQANNIKNLAQSQSGTNGENMGKVPLAKLANLSESLCCSVVPLQSGDIRVRTLQNGLITLKEEDFYDENGELFDDAS